MSRVLFVIPSSTLYHWQKQCIQLVNDHCGERPYVMIRPDKLGLPPLLKSLFGFSQRRYKPLVDAFLPTPLDTNEAELVDNLESVDALVVNLTDYSLDDYAAPYWEFRYGQFVDSMCDFSLKSALRNENSILSSLIQRKGNEAIVLEAGSSAAHPLAFYRSSCEVLMRQCTYVFRSLDRYKGLKPVEEYPIKLTKPAVVSLRKQLSLMVRVLRRLIDTKLEKSSSNWVMACSEGATFQKEHYQVFTPAEGMLWADPILYEKDDKTHVFFEEKPIGKGRGYIMVAELAGHQLLNPKKIISEPFHLSYPFIFEYKGQLYMIPETEEDNSIRLYRCEAFPHHWVFDSYLVKNIKAVDSTVFYHSNKWWLFANVKSVKGASIQEELCIYHASSPISNDWQPHPKNPVVSGITHSRPAGPLFKTDDGLVRPAQDSSIRYGYAINFRLIEKLDEVEYVERPYDRLEPWGSKIMGIHTFNRGKDLTFVDLRIKT